MDTVQARALIATYFPPVTETFAARKTIIDGLKNLARHYETNGSAATVTALTKLAEQAKTGRFFERRTVEKFQETMAEIARAPASSAGPDGMLGFVAKALGLGNWQNVLIMDRLRTLEQSAFDATGKGHDAQLAARMGFFAAEASRIYHAIVTNGGADARMAVHVQRASLEKERALHEAEAYSTTQISARHAHFAFFGALAEAVPVGFPLQKAELTRLARDVDHFMVKLGQDYPAPFPRPAERIFGMFEVIKGGKPAEELAAALLRNDQPRLPLQNTA